MPPRDHFLFLLISGAFGACIGSFLNVVIYRLPQQKSLVTPPSTCPSCGMRIHFYDNIPLLSYIFLAGKCRHCKKSISLRYPSVEFLTALLFILIYAVDVIGMGYSGEPNGLVVGIIHMVFVAVLVAITFIDFDHRIIPDELSLGGSVAALVLVTALPDKLAPLLSFTSDWDGWQLYAAGALTGLAGGVAGAGITWLTGFFGKLAFKKDAMGFGDVKLMLMIGILLGWKAVIIVFFMAPFFGLMVALPRYAIKKDSYIAYGPFLSIAAVAYILFSEYIDAWLKNLLHV
ncbi:MAG: prepilin peptidase [Planctomycetota bacterium]|nr:prepilin peptidase [Planctomycetota bacterium]